MSIHNLQMAVTKLETQLEGTKKHIGTLYTRYEQLQIRDLQNTVHELSQQLVDTVKEVNTLETRCEQLEKRLVPLESVMPVPGSYSLASAECHDVVPGRRAPGGDSYPEPAQCPFVVSIDSPEKIHGPKTRYSSGHTIAACPATSPRSSTRARTWP